MNSDLEGYKDVHILSPLGGGLDRSLVDSRVPRLHVLDNKTLVPRTNAVLGAQGDKLTVLPPACRGQCGHSQRKRKYCASRNRIGVQVVIVDGWSVGRS